MTKDQRELWWMKHYLGCYQMWTRSPGQTLELLSVRKSYVPWIVHYPSTQHLVGLGCWGWRACSVGRLGLWYRFPGRVAGDQGQRRGCWLNQWPHSHNGGFWFVLHSVTRFACIISFNLCIPKRWILLMKIKKKKKKKDWMGSVGSLCH